MSIIFVFNLASILNFIMFSCLIVAVSHNEIKVPTQQFCVYSESLIFRFYNTSCHLDTFLHLLKLVLSVQVIAAVDLLNSTSWEWASYTTSDNKVFKFWPTWSHLMCFTEYELGYLSFIVTLSIHNVFICDEHSWHSNWSAAVLIEKVKRGAQFRSIILREAAVLLKRWRLYCTQQTPDTNLKCWWNFI